MSVLSLTRRQRDGVSALVRARQIQGIASGGDERRARSFLANADAALADMGLVRSPLVQHDLAYAVMHDVGEAMLAAHGYRTAPGQGQHAAVASFLAAIFDAPPPSEAALRVDDVRRNRNDRYYRATTPSAAEATGAAQDAQVLLSAAHARLS